MFHTLKKMLKLHAKLLSGKISFTQYFERTRVKLREFVFNRALIRHYFKRKFKKHELIIKLATPDDINKCLNDKDQRTRSGKKRPLSNVSVRTRKQINTHSYIAMYENIIAGKINLSPFSQWERFGLSGYMISGASVKPMYRGLGIGEALYRFLLADAKTKNITRIYQTINKSNIRNNSLSLKLGFKRIDPDTEKKLMKQMRMNAYYINL